MSMPSEPALLLSTVPGTTTNRGEDAGPAARGELCTWVRGLPVGVEDFLESRGLSMLASLRCTDMCSFFFPVS